MATGNSLHRDTADRFNDEAYGSGIQNAQATYATKSQPERRPANENHKPVRYQELNSYSTDTPIETAANSNRAPTPVQRRKKTRLAVVQQIIRINTARVRATPIAVGISVWAWPWYLFLTLPLAILASVSIGISYAISSEVDELAVASAIADYQGISPDAFLVVFLGLSGILLFLNVCQLIIASFMFKVGFIKPWFGHGAAFKLGSIIVLLISSFVPLLNMFPLLGLWVFAVVINPK